LAVGGSPFRGLGSSEFLQWAEKEKIKMNIQLDQSNLRHILNANAMFSFSSGLFFLLASKPLAGFLGASPMTMYILSIILFGYAVLIAFNTYRTTISRGFALFTVLGDSAWVIASILLLVLPFFRFSTDAKWAIGITAVCVDIFATLQFLEWHKMS
jgi:hypothetical protein